VFGGTSIQKLYQQFRAALEDKNVLSIVLDIDSPGGEVAGTRELANFIFQSRGRKKTIAVANGQALSAAYWLASAADELVVTQSGEVGSIGIVAVHDDISGALQQAGIKMSLIKAGRYKTDGNPFEPLSETARGDMQSKVSAVYDWFVSDVARGRGVQQATVRNGFGCGFSLLANDAVRQGMADRVATLDETLIQVVSGLDAPMLSSRNASVFVLSRQLDRRIAQNRELELRKLMGSIARGARRHVPPGIARRERELELRERMGRDC
jgi:signal peptide peptidase SppA